MGSGAGVAPYSFGASSASSAAMGGAKADTERRLEGEAELVPCPRCNWINEDLITGYRNSCYRGYFGSVVAVATVVLAACLVMSWFVWIGPQADHGTLRYLLIYFPLAIIASVVCVKLFIGWLRCRIQPNVNFPLAPNIPRGTPRALMVSASGELITVNSFEQLTADDSFDFQIGKHRFPAACCCCLEKSNFEYVLGLAALPGTELQIPICFSCGTQSVRRKKRIGIIVGIATFIASLAAMLGLGLKDETFWILAVASGIISASLGGFVRHNAARVAWITAIDRMRGVVRIRFQNPQYRSRLVEAQDSIELGSKVL